MKEPLLVHERDIKLNWMKTVSLLSDKSRGVTGARSRDVMKARWNEINFAWKFELKKWKNYVKHSKQMFAVEQIIESLSPVSVCLSVCLSVYIAVCVCLCTDYVSCTCTACRLHATLMTSSGSTRDSTWRDDVIGWGDDVSGWGRDMWDVPAARDLHGESREIRGKFAGMGTVVARMLPEWNFITAGNLRGVFEKRAAMRFLDRPLVISACADVKCVMFSLKFLTAYEKHA